MILSVARQKRGTSTLVLLGPSTTASRATTSWKNLCSGLGRPFFRMLFSVVSEKCKRPMDTRIGWLGGKGQEDSRWCTRIVTNSLFGDDYDPDDSDPDPMTILMLILMRSKKHLVTTECKFDWEESLPGPVSLALLNLQRMLTFFWLFF